MTNNDIEGQTPDENELSGPPAERMPHVLRAGPYTWQGTEDPDPSTHREHVEPWLSALVQSEHLNLLIGSGFTNALADASGSEAVGMGLVSFDCLYSDRIEKAALRTAEALGRGTPNFEDQVGAVLELLGGLRILTALDEKTPPVSEETSEAHKCWREALDTRLRALISSVLDAERGIDDALCDPSEVGDQVRQLMGGFLLPFASRAAPRERLHIFTTNYDRVLEHGCDLLGLRTIDRFVGTLTPAFRSSRLRVDMHYNPPGMRGEPRYLEGVVRLTKLHGSIDWISARKLSGGSAVRRQPAPFGAPSDHPSFPSSPIDELIIYPNPAKDVETLHYPYADLFRDFAAASSRPNSVVVTYGYGYGDGHVNRVIADMLSIPSTHLVIISHGPAGGRIARFLESVSRREQVTLLLGPHFGDLEALVTHYLPKPAIDRATWRMVDLLARRTRPTESSQPKASNAGAEEVN